MWTGTPKKQTPQVRIARLFSVIFAPSPNSPETYEFDLWQQGNNLLLFGENGSGKSLARSLRFTPKPAPMREADEQKQTTGIRWRIG